MNRWISTTFGLVLAFSVIGCTTSEDAAAKAHAKAMSELAGEIAKAPDAKTLEAATGKVEQMSKKATQMMEKGSEAAKKELGEATGKLGKALMEASIKLSEKKMP